MKYIIFVIVLMIAATIWGLDLHELFIKEKRADKIRALQADIKHFIQKLSRLLGILSENCKKMQPYILVFFKWLLRLARKLWIIIRKILKWITGKLKDLFQEMEDRNHEIDSALLLNNNENLEMIEKLGECAYVSPSLADFYIDHHFAVSYKAGAAGKRIRYEEVKEEDFENLILLTVRNFFLMKRKVPVYVRIIAATPDYLHFVVTFTPYGWNRLLQIYPPQESKGQQMPLPALEESIPEEEMAEEEAENEDSESW